MSTHSVWRPAHELCQRDLAVLQKKYEHLCVRHATLKDLTSELSTMIEEILRIVDPDSEMTQHATKVLREVKQICATSNTVVDTDKRAGYTE